MNPQYSIDLDFSNIKSLTYFAELMKTGEIAGTPREKADQIGLCEEAVSLTCMIETHFPCPSSKREVSSDPEKPQTYEFTRSRSPFNMEPEELYLNNWNLNQTYVFKGQSTYSMVDKFIEVVKK